jgi:hypothetical protein
LNLSVVGSNPRGSTIFYLMIYIIRQKQTDHVKIGYTRNNNTLRKRIKTLQTGCPNKLIFEAKMNGSKLKERFLHHTCIKRHIYGEWFKLTREEVIRLVLKYKDFAPTKHGITKQSQI